VKGLVLGAAALWVAGIALVALSVAQGGATVTLVLIVPVVSGSSLEFLLGVVLLIAGFVALLLAFSVGGVLEAGSLPSEEATDTGPSSGASRGGVGGVVLIGPVPIVFGSWRGISRRARWALVLLGTLLVIAAVLASVWLLR
jgi:uncharacterized protein (TIGR00304 family)